MIVEKKLTEGQYCFPAMLAPHKIDELHCKKISFSLQRFISINYVFSEEIIPF
ncbi:hypothetical protein [Nitrosomonas communis]|uniref:hypothetical protein n=1 Tax=Nitrosomonas communis TaxID=44574 RepID=UPI003D2A943D